MLLQILLKKNPKSSPGCDSNFEGNAVFESWEEEDFSPGVPVLPLGNYNYQNVSKAPFNCFARTSPLHPLTRWSADFCELLSVTAKFFCLKEAGKGFRLRARS